jgi:hypothetical protein
MLQHHDSAFHFGIAAGEIVPAFSLTLLLLLLLLLLP